MKKHYTKKRAMGAKPTARCRPGTMSVFEDRLRARGVMASPTCCFPAPLTLAFEPFSTHFYAGCLGLFSEGTTVIPLAVPGRVQRGPLHVVSTPTGLEGLSRHSIKRTVSDRRTPSVSL